MSRMEKRERTKKEKLEDIKLQGKSPKLRQREREKKKGWNDLEGKRGRKDK